MRILLIFLFTALILPSAFALEIGASVTNVFSTDLRYFHFNNSYDTQWFDAEVFNTGSLAYTAQARIVVRNENGTVFTGWSGKKSLAPGSNALFRIFWRPKISGNYTAMVRIYASGEVMDMEFNITARAGPGEDAFSIEQTRTFRNSMVLKIRSKTDANETIAIPDGYPQGWQFGQTSAILNNGDEKEVLLLYMPAIWAEQKIFIDIASRDGKFFSREEVQLKREEGLAAMLHNLLFSLLK